MSRQKLTDQHQPVNYDLSPFMPNNLSRSVSFQHDVSGIFVFFSNVKIEMISLSNKVD